MKPSFLFYGKKGDYFCKLAAEFINLHTSDSEIVLGKRGDVFPGNTAYWDGDVIISYLSPWIIPEYVLKKAKKAAINFLQALQNIQGSVVQILQFIMRRKSLA
ncbi:MAG: hypothetical protein ACEB74_14430 [Desulfovibrio aminophilus]|uniref:hypothetical protein n=1 Tax=Desulfovibrio aminophilus TaxID=81425 RepID=UPI0039E9618C